jgi:spore maturation protein CgeB
MAPALMYHAARTSMGTTIVYAGVGDGTCRHRANALAALGHTVHHVLSGPPRSRAGFQLYRVSYKLGRPFDLCGANAAIAREVARRRADVVWIDKGLEIRPATLAALRRQPSPPALVAYSPDDMLNPQNQSRYYLEGLALYDLHVTTKSYNVAELRELGARDVIFVDNAFDPATHRPLELSAEDRLRYGAGAGFVGAMESDRAEQIVRLAEAGIEVAVRGPGWERLGRSHPNLRLDPRTLHDIEYTKAINATRINLGFLRKVNRDQQTTRSVEIPACGAFLLAERTDEHLRLFEEGREAEFFSSFDELLEKCRHYLAHDAERQAVAAAGRRRCLASDYSNAGRLAGVLAHLARMTP